MRQVYLLAPFVVLVSLLLVACQPVQPVEDYTQVPVQQDQAPVPTLSREECVALLPATEAFLYANDYDAVDTIYTAILACDIPDSLRTNVYRLLANLDSERGDYDAAIDDYFSTLKLGLTDEDAAIVHNNICWFYTITGRPETALSHCEKAVALDPLPSHLDSRGVTYALLGEVEAAIADLQVAVEAWTDIQNAQAQEVRALRLAWLEELESGANPFTVEVLEALKAESFQGATSGTLAESTASPEAGDNFQRGREHHIWNRLEEAVAAYTAAIAVDPAYEKAHFYRGIAYSQLERYEEALDDFEQVIDSNPEYTNAYRLCAQVSNELGNFQEAVACYDKAIELAPGVADFYANRGLANFSLREMQRAIADFDEALRITGPRLPYILFSRGFAHYLLSHRVEAILDLQLAIDLGIPPEIEDLAEEMLLELRQVL